MVVEEWVPEPENDITGLQTADPVPTLTTSTSLEASIRIVLCLILEKSPVFPNTSQDVSASMLAQFGQHEWRSVSTLPNLVASNSLPKAFKWTPS